MDELHHENEELHAQLEAVQKENADMKAKLSAMADDSEKLGGLKVSWMTQLCFLCTDIACWQLTEIF